MLKNIASLLLLVLSGAVSAQVQLNQQWVATYGGTANNIDYGRALQIDAYGNAFIAGTVTNTGTGKDIAVVKYNSAGLLQWAALYDDTLHLDDWAYALVMDADGNLYATGFISTMAEGKNFITVKIDSSGSILWAAVYNGSANLDDAANDITLDLWGNIIVTGISKGTGTGDDYATVKYNSSGIPLWISRYDGPASGVDDARTIAADNIGNVYVSGGSTGLGTDYDFATVKYDSAGNELWARRYDGPLGSYDLIYYQGAIAVDSLFNVYITGYSKGLDSTLDYATVKYDSAGTELWVSRYFSEAGGTDYADAITLDDSLNVYVTGGSYRTPNNYDFATVKYNSQGAQQWVSYYNGTANDWDEAYDIVTDDSLNVYIVGRSPSSTTSADFVTIKYNLQGTQEAGARYFVYGYDWPFSIRLSPDYYCIYVGGSLGTTISDLGVIKYCQTPIGVEENNSVTGNVFLYPNPASFLLYFSFPEAGNYLLTIKNILGSEILKSQILNPESEIDISDFPAGIYFVTITDEKKNVAMNPPATAKKPMRWWAGKFVKM